MTFFNSMSVLTLELKRAPWAVLWLTLLIAAVLLACWQLPWSAAWAGGATLLVLGWYVQALWRHAGSGGPVQAIRHDASGWQIARNGEWQPARLEAATVWPPMVLLRLSCTTGSSSITCWLIPGRVAAEPLRRLRVLLRHGPTQAH